MTPAARTLASDHHALAVTVAYSVHVGFRADPDVRESVAGEAVCEAATAWVDRGLSGPFEGFLTTVVRRRVYDEWRNTYGRKTESSRRPGLRADSLDRPVGDGPTTVRDLTVIPDDGGHDAAEDAHYLRGLADRGRLTVREREVLARRAEGETLGEIGVSWGASESRACQVSSLARKKARAAA